eukprot:4505411-Pyramimonas_sp.AAC.1
MLPNVSLQGSLLALVVETTASDQVEHLTGSEVAADSRSASPRLSTTDLTDADAVGGKAKVDGVELNDCLS